MLTKLTADTAYEDGLSRLQEAIVMQAIDDYKDALYVVDTTRSYKKREAARIKADSCEVFFRGAWFQMLTGGKADGDAVIKALKQSERR
jgi:hypothetical protein